MLSTLNLDLQTGTRASALRAGRAGWLGGDGGFWKGWWWGRYLGGKGWVLRGHAKYRRDRRKSSRATRTPQVRLALSPQVMWGTLPFLHSLGALGLVISGGEEEEEAWLGYKRLLQWWMFEDGPKRLIISGESGRNDEYLRLGQNV